MNGTSLAHARTLSPNPARARRELLTLLEDAAWPGEPHTVVLAVHEALMNCVHHAGGAIAATAGLDGYNGLVVEIRDRGPRFDVAPYMAERPDPLGVRGRGLWLIGQIATDLRLEREDDENRLWLYFRP